jgi:TolB-like protein
MARLSLATLGGLEIGGAATPGPSLPRKAQGMLAYLALNGAQPVSREKLAALFWGDSPDSQARTNLRQNLSSLRRFLAAQGVEALVTEGDRVALDLEAIDIDVATFEALCAAGTPEALAQAAALYGGGFLDGFSLREESFESWARIERQRLRGLAIEALCALADRSEEAGDLEGAMAAANRLLALDPLREQAHRLLMRGHGAQGRLGAALKQFETCRETLARELGVQPEAATQELYRELRERRLSTNGGGGRAAAQATKALEEAGPAISAAPPTDRPSIVVWPFENLGGDSEQDYFAAGITENIIMGLTRFQDLFVIGLKSAFAARDDGEAAEQTGRRLGVRYLVEGRVRRSGKRVRVTAQLIEAASGRRLWAERYDRDLDDLFAVQDEITDVIVATVAGRIEEAGRRHAEAKRPQDMDVYDCLLRGRHCLNQYTRATEIEARRHFERALALEPNNAAAHAGLAVSHLHEFEAVWAAAPERSLERAFELAQKAVALDEFDSMARYAMANTYYYRQEYELAKLQVEKALELNPNDYHNICSKGWIMTFSGQVAEGVACSTEGMRINPFARLPQRLLCAAGPRGGGAGDRGRFWESGSGGCPGGSGPGVRSSATILDQLSPVPAPGGPRALIWRHARGRNPDLTPGVAKIRAALA